MTSLLIASRNSHKVQEVRAILGQGFHYLTLNDFPNAPKIIEDAGTFAGKEGPIKFRLAITQQDRSLAGVLTFYLPEGSGTNAYTCGLWMAPTHSIATRRTPSTNHRTIRRFVSVSLRSMAG